MDVLAAAAPTCGRSGRFRHCCYCLQLVGHDVKLSFKVSRQFFHHIVTEVCEGSAAHAGSCRFGDGGRSCGQSNILDEVKVCGKVYLLL